MSTRESDLEQEEWKFQAPYRVHAWGDNFQVKLEASCHCGKVRYQLSREKPLSSKLCHCMDCQTQHGAPFQWAAIFHKDDINFINGHRDLEWYDPARMTLNHTLPSKVRCSHCRSPIMDEGRNMILLFPSLINLNSEKARNDFKPKCHIFYSQRAMDILDGLPKWTGMNDASELMDESTQVKI